jgi:hypothetical protein
MWEGQWKSLYLKIELKLLNYFIYDLQTEVLLYLQNTFKC